jgi:hypothetical protein
MVDTTFVQFLSLPRTKKELVFYQLADIFLTKPDSFNTWVLLLFMVAFSQYGSLFDVLLTTFQKLPLYRSAKRKRKWPLNDFHFPIF